tara:strand:- start:36 stop:1106 length:1071 start_codon:yes stop_codon:yes gene_type:complete
MKHLILLFILISNSDIFAQQFPTEGYSLSNPTFLDSTISDYNVVFTAEMHWNKFNDERKKEMVTYLAKNNRINTIVLEASYSYGYWLNQFLENGDTIFLKELTSIYNSTDDADQKIKYQDSYSLYSWLYEFTQTNNLTIKMTGVDLEFIYKPQRPLWSFVKITEKFKDLQVLSKSISDAEHLLTQEKITKSQFKKWFSALEKDISKQKISNSIFNQFINNIEQSLNFGASKGFIYREQVMYQNFLSMINKDDKVFGQFGLSHIMLDDRQMSKNRLTTYLNQNQLFKDKILSIGLVNYDFTTAGSAPYDEYLPFLTKEEFERLTPEFKKLPTNTFVDLRNTDEEIKKYSQLLLIVHE